MPLLAPTKPKKNMLPPFTSGQWTLHENTRMKQANFIGKVSGSTVENPHSAKATGNGPLQIPSSGVWGEYSQPGYGFISTQDGGWAQSTYNTNGNVAQHLFSFNLIEHVLRNYGTTVFGTAVTVADRVAWVKANVSKLGINWYGYGSGPGGNRAYLQCWNGSAWFGTGSHIASTVTVLSRVDPVANFASGIDTNGFAHFIAYADASDGVTASVIRSDFVQLDVYMNAGSIPQPDYELTLTATSTFHQSFYTMPALPNTQYCLRGISQSGRVYVVFLDATGASISFAYLYGTTNLDVGNGADVSKVIASPANAVSAQVVCDNSNITTGTSTFRNLQLEQGSVATPFEPYIPIPDNKPALQGLRFNGLSDYVALPDIGVQGQIRVEALVRPTAPNGKILGKHSSGTNIQGTLGVDPSGKAQFEITLGGVYNSLVDTTPLSPTKMSRVAGSFDGSTIRLFVDGVQVASQSRSGSIATNAFGWAIGRLRAEGSSAYFSGDIAEVRLYNRADGDRSGMLGEWLLNEVQGTIANDTSGNGNHGTISGASWVVKKAPQRVNLLGTDGGFEKDSNNDGLADSFYTGFGVTAKSLDGTKSVSGRKSQKLSTSAGGVEKYIGRDIGVELGKLYVVLVDICRSANNTYFEFGVKSTGWGTIASQRQNHSADFQTMYIKFMGGANTNRLVIDDFGSSDAADFWVDGMRLYEIDKATYDKIGVAPEYTGATLAAKFPYVEGLQSLGSILKPAVKTPKKNVLPLFNDPIFTLQNGAQPSSDGRTLTVNTSSPTQVIFASTPAAVQVEPGVQYLLSATCTGVARVRLGKNDNSFLQSITPSAPSRGFTAIESTLRLTIDNNGLTNETAGPGPGSISDLMICKASEDQIYEPYTLVNKPAAR